MYYFNLKGNGEDRPAEVPVAFASLDAAKDNVLEGIRVVFHATPEEYQFRTLLLCFEICDEDGDILDVVPFRDAIIFH